MKQTRNILEQLKSLPYFTKDEIWQLGSQHGIAPSTVNTFISRSLKRKDIYSLKKSFYITADFYEKNKGKTPYLFFLANVLRKPSYISSWSALQYYNLATEGIRSITSVTPKVTRSYNTKISSFSYSSISEELFDGFVLRGEEFEYYIATPAKALFDMLYFKTKRFKDLSTNRIPALLEDLRIDTDEMDSKECDAFYEMVKEYKHHE